MKKLFLLTLIALACLAIDLKGVQADYERSPRPYGYYGRYHNNYYYPQPYSYYRGGYTNYYPPRYYYNDYGYGSYGYNPRGYYRYHEYDDDWDW